MRLVFASLLILSACNMSPRTANELALECISGCHGLLAQEKNRCTNGKDIPSCRTVAIMFLEGYGVERDAAESERYAQFGCSRGDAESCLIGTRAIGQQQLDEQTAFRAEDERQQEELAAMEQQTALLEQQCLGGEVNDCLKLFEADVEKCSGVWSSCSRVEDHITAICSNSDSRGTCQKAVGMLFTKYPDQSSSAGQEACGAHRVAQACWRIGRTSRTYTERSCDWGNTIGCIRNGLFDGSARSTASGSRAAQARLVEADEKAYLEWYLSQAVTYGYDDYDEVQVVLGRMTSSGSQTFYAGWTKTGKKEEWSIGLTATGSDWWFLEDLDLKLDGAKPKKVKASSSREILGGGEIEESLWGKLSQADLKKLANAKEVRIRARGKSADVTLDLSTIDQKVILRLVEMVGKVKKCKDKANCI